MHNFKKSASIIYYSILLQRKLSFREFKNISQGLTIKKLLSHNTKSVLWSHILCPPNTEKSSSLQQLFSMAFTNTNHRKLKDMDKTPRWMPVTSQQPLFVKCPFIFLLDGSLLWSQLSFPGNISGLNTSALTLSLCPFISSSINGIPWDTKVVVWCLFNH